MFGIILTLILLAFVNRVLTTNYCDHHLCTTGFSVRPHIGCNHNGQFASNCQQPAMVELSSHFQRAILQAHNELRNKLANGTLPRFTSAIRMPTLTWDAELAYLAKLHVLGCRMMHDECRNTDAYRFAGQNLAIQYSSAVIGASQYERLAVDLINQWFDEHENAIQADLDMFKSTKGSPDGSLVTRCLGLGKAGGGDIGHFTAMVHEKTSKVGCAIATFYEFAHNQRWSAMLLTCNYSFNNLLRRPIYRKGPMCSACQTGCNPEFNGLCSLAENVQPVP